MAEIDAAAAWAAWEDVQLAQRLPRLNDQAQAMFHRIEEARSRRKHLVEETKRFRTEVSSVPESVLLKFSTLVQSYVIVLKRTPNMLCLLL